MRPVLESGNSHWLRRLVISFSGLQWFTAQPPVFIELKLWISNTAFVMCFRYDLCINCFRVSSTLTLYHWVLCAQENFRTSVVSISWIQLLITKHTVYQASTLVLDVWKSPLFIEPVRYCLVRMVLSDSSYDLYLLHIWLWLLLHDVMPKMVARQSWTNRKNIGKQIFGSCFLKTSHLQVSFISYCVIHHSMSSFHHYYILQKYLKLTIM